MKNINVTIITNGNYASAEDYKLLHKLGVGLFEIPILSSRPEIHDYLTNVPNSWNNAINSCKQITDNGGKVIPVVVVCKPNAIELAKTLEFIADLGYKQIMINRFNIGGKGISEIDNILQSIDELKHAFTQASDIGYKRNLLLSSNVCTPLCILNPNDCPNVRFTTCSTDVFKRPITLDSNGNIRLCNHSPMIIGNIHTENFQKIFEKQKVKDWANVTPDVCANCKLYSNCMGGCRAATEQMKLDLSNADPIINLSIKNI